MTDYLPEGRRIDTYENLEQLSSLKSLNDAMRDGKILEARATVCDQSHNLIVDLGFMKGIIRRVLGAGLAIELVDVFLETEFEGGRHQRRVDKISELEK